MNVIVSKKISLQNSISPCRKKRRGHILDHYDLGARRQHFGRRQTRTYTDIQYLGGKLLVQVLWPTLRWKRFHSSGTLLLLWQDRSIYPVRFFWFEMTEHCYYCPRSADKKCCLDKRKVAAHRFLSSIHDRRRDPVWNIQEVFFLAEEIRENICKFNEM